MSYIFNNRRQAGSRKHVGRCVGDWNEAGVRSGDESVGWGMRIGGWVGVLGKGKEECSDGLSASFYFKNAHLLTGTLQNSR